MSEEQRKFLSVEETVERISSRGREFVAVRNPSYVYPPEEFYPLVPKTEGTVDRIVAVVQDMDGTTTTTETLCLHSLETMVRRITGRPTARDWAGLDRTRDYPHVIGNSTTRHVEYLVKAYGDRIDHGAMVRAQLEAAAWTLTEGADPARRTEVMHTLEALGWNRCLASDEDWNRLVATPSFDPAAARPVMDRLIGKYVSNLAVNGFNEQVRVSIDIYYHRYHEILKAIAMGRGAELAGKLTDNRPLIEPMPGVAVFQALVKGWLGDKAGALYDMLRDSLREVAGLPAPDIGRKRLAALGRAFARNPARVGVVTSSIRYEADIVLGEVLRLVRNEIGAWPVCSELAAGLNTLGDLFDVIVTASDSSEIRLKPHRDLYSIALHALGVEPDDFDKVIGFEDSESGTIAIRAAGIGLCVAVPFADTAGHDLSAATHVARGGLPQVILERNLFLAAGDG